MQHPPPQKKLTTVSDYLPNPRIMTEDMLYLKYDIFVEL